MVKIIDKNGSELYSIYEISKLVGLSKSTTRRIILSNQLQEVTLFKNEMYYDKETLFNIMKEALIKRVIKGNGLQEN
jgi:hypothetical protein